MKTSMSIDLYLSVYVALFASKLAFWAKKKIMVKKTEICLFFKKVL